MGTFSVCSFVSLFACPPLWAIQPGLRPSQLCLMPSQPASQASGFTQNPMTIRKNFPGATIWDQPRFFIFFGLEVTAFPRYTTLWWLLDLWSSDLVTLVGYSFVRKNLNIKNQMTVGKRFSRATKWDHPRFFFFFGLEVTAFPRYTTLWWLLDLGHSDHFTLVGFSSIFPICPNPPCLSQSTPSVPIH